MRILSQCWFSFLFQYAFQNGTIKLHNLKMDDAGTYRCIASNDLYKKGLPHQDNKTMELEVVGNAIINFVIWYKIIVY